MKEREILKLLKILPVGGLARKIIERSAKRYLIKRFQYERGVLGEIRGESFNNESKETLRLFKKEKREILKKFFGD